MSAHVLDVLNKFFIYSREDAKAAMKKIYKYTAVPLTKIHHTGLDSVSSRLLKNMDSGSAKNTVRNDGILF